MRLLVCLLIAVIAGVTSQAVAAQRTDGLLKDCEGRDYRLCLGYIMGFYDGRTTQDYGKLELRSCPPTSPDGLDLDVTYEQMVLVFVKWARENPARHHWGDWQSVREAFAKAWPCRE